MNDFASETTAMLTYGMSDKLRNSGLLSQISNLSHEDKTCLIRYIYLTDRSDSFSLDDLEDSQAPYTMEELNARIDEAEKDVDRGEGKTFEEMMAGFRENLLWLK